MGVLQVKLGRDRLLDPDNLGRRIGRRLLAKMPLDAEMYRQDDGDNGRGAQHQDREENFNYHRDLGYQKAKVLSHRPVASKPRIDQHLRQLFLCLRAGCTSHASSNFSSPSFSRLQAILSPAFSQTCFSLGMPQITPSGVPVKMMSPGRREMRAEV